MISKYQKRTISVSEGLVAIALYPHFTLAYFKSDLTFFHIKIIYFDVDRTLLWRHYMWKRKYYFYTCFDVIMTFKRRHFDVGKKVSTYLSQPVWSGPKPKAAIWAYRLPDFENLGVRWPLWAYGFYFWRPDRNLGVSGRIQEHPQ